MSKLQLFGIIGNVILLGAIVMIYKAKSLPENRRKTLQRIALTIVGILGVIGFILIILIKAGQL